MIASPAGAKAPDSRELVCRLMTMVRSKSDDLLNQIDHDWVLSAARRAGVSDKQPLDLKQRRRWHAALAALYGLKWPSIDSFYPRAHRLALLPRPELLRVLATVALHNDRESVRRCIGRAMREGFVTLVGEHAFRGILDAPEWQPGDHVRSLCEGDLDLVRLAFQGYDVLRQQQCWHSRPALAWVRLSLPREWTDADCPALPAYVDPAPVLTRLPDYFPEHSWLFGSSMDRVLSE